MKRISPIRARGAEAPALLELKTSLQETKSALSHAYTAFDYTSDPELTEACIYEIRSLQARMNYLVRQIKELELCAATAVGAPAGWGLWRGPGAVTAAVLTVRAAAAREGFLRAAVNALLGLAALFLVNASAGYTGVSLGFNLFNGLVAGVLGIPGVALLVLVQWALT